MQLRWRSKGESMRKRERRKEGKEEEEVEGNEPLSCELADRSLSLFLFRRPFL